MPDAIDPTAPRCKVCGCRMDRMTAASRNGICTAIGCEQERKSRASRAIAERDWSAFRDRMQVAYAEAAPAISATAQEHHIDLRRTTVVVVPRSGRPLTEPPPERIEAFTKRLDKQIAKAFEDPPPIDQRAVRAGQDRAGPPSLGAACATCKGACCHLGAENHAFIVAETIRDFRYHVPDATALEVRESYLAAIPEMTVHESCLFHGEFGCTLEIRQRHEICSIHFCEDLKGLSRTGKLPGEGPFLYAARQDGSDTDLGTWSLDEGYVALDTPLRPPSTTASEDLAADLLNRLPTAPPTEPGRMDSPPIRRCRWCSADINVTRAVTTGSCGAPGCEQERIAAVSKGYSR